ncbi:MAG: TetR/AcrR family transcriptional regulator [Mariprofundaceae bacterium]
MTQKDPQKTRETILEAAFQEINLHGFQAASISHILEKTSMTKGALFYHFPNKLALGYAVLEKIVEPMIYDTWLQPLAAIDNPIDAIQQMLRDAPGYMNETHHSGDEALLFGCPLNHLAQEMAALDVEFRDRINAVFSGWQEGLAILIQQGQQDGYIRSDTDANNTAKFIVAAIQGILDMAKRSQDKRIALGTFQSCADHLIDYLDTLRGEAR